MNLTTGNGVVFFILQNVSRAGNQQLQQRSEVTSTRQLPVPSGMIKFTFFSLQFQITGSDGVILQNVARDGNRQLQQIYVVISTQQLPVLSGMI